MCCIYATLFWACTKWINGALKKLHLNCDMTWPRVEPGKHIILWSRKWGQVGLIHSPPGASISCIYAIFLVSTENLIRHWNRFSLHNGPDSNRELLRESDYANKVSRWDPFTTRSYSSLYKLYLHNMFWFLWKMNYFGAQKDTVSTAQHDPESNHDQDSNRKSAKTSHPQISKCRCGRFTTRSYYRHPLFWKINELCLKRLCTFHLSVYNQAYLQLWR
jgi:hypothetical protein